MRKIIIFLIFLLTTDMVYSQNHPVRRQTNKSTQQNTTNPTTLTPTKPKKKPNNADAPNKPSNTARPFIGCPNNNHPHMIDLGLPSGTKWACCNVGANKPEDYGDYYAWGETNTKSNYSWSNYKHCDGSRDNCHNLGSNITGTQNDVAHVKWGKTWQMPTLDQCKELLDQCNKGKWTTVNGVEGRRFTGPNGASIFLPAAGTRCSSGLLNVGGHGDYWSSSQSPSDSSYASGLYFNSDLTYWYYDNIRSDGFSVRPVSK